jgi:uncharacterized protein YndB with AHSA1/START domain
MPVVVARSEMLIRSPAKAIFKAFVEPAWLKKFWLKNASRPLALGETVHWEFLVPGAKEEVTVIHMEDGQRIAFGWSDGKNVEIRLKAFGRGTTRVIIEVRGFKGSAAAAEAIGATEGFAIVLCDLKALLENGSSGRMVRDKAKLIATDK